MGEPWVALLPVVWARRPARRPLTRWLGERMKQTLDDRFDYVEVDLPLRKDDLDAVDEAFRRLSR